MLPLHQQIKQNRTENSSAWNDDFLPLNFDSRSVSKVMIALRLKRGKYRSHLGILDETLTKGSSASKNGVGIFAKPLWLKPMNKASSRNEICSTEQCRKVKNLFTFSRETLLTAAFSVDEIFNIPVLLRLQQLGRTVKWLQLEMTLAYW